MEFQRSLARNPLRNISYLLACPRTGDAVVVDPWDAAGPVREALRRGWTLRFAVSTHSHSDHVCANLELKALVPGLRVLCHPLAARRVPGADGVLEPGRSWRVGRELELGVIDAPGHTMDHLCLFAEGDEPALLSGDTLFDAGVGNCRHGGDPRLLHATVARIVADLPPSTRLLPGHDYLERNLGFTLEREPGNASGRRLLASLGAGAPPVLDLATQRRINVFLRLDSAEVVEGLRSAFPGRSLEGAEERFLALRELRDRY